MSKKHYHDLSVRNLPGVVSLRKALKDPTVKASKGPFTVLVGDVAIRNNAKDQVMEVSPKDRRTQALYFSKQFPNSHPGYLYKYLKIMYHTEKDTDIRDLLVGLKHNKELQQIVGLIQLVAGGLNLARKTKSGIRFYIIEPETHLHPKRASAVITLLDKLYNDYGNERTKESKVQSD